MADSNYQEGDYVPGQGVLMPDGTYKAVNQGDTGSSTGDGADPTIKINSSTDSGTNHDSSGVNPQYAFFSAIADANTAASSGGTPPVTLQDAINLAMKDPSIVQKYSDALNIDTQDFTNSLAQLQLQATNTAKSQELQFKQDRETLANAEASAGTAYSGFRKQAEDNLAETESGIVTSSRSQQQATLDSMRQAFASKYGTAATPNATLSYTSPLNAGGVSISGLNTSNIGNDVLSGQTPNLIGSQGLQEKQDVLSEAKDTLAGIPSLGSLVSK